MKLFKFFRWQWNRFEFWQKWWICSMAFFFLGLFSDKLYFQAIGVSMLIFGIFKWLIWEGVSDSYKKFKEEQNTLFEVIKNSDKK